ncbi:hypothetical protein D046_8420B, partial [Vibrio parahaemolyticus V-223/04]
VGKRLALINSALFCMISRSLLFSSSSR